jgi:hypothetical protein
MCESIFFSCVTLYAQNQVDPVVTCLLKCRLNNSRQNRPDVDHPRIFSKINLYFPPVGGWWTTDSKLIWSELRLFRLPSHVMGCFFRRIIMMKLRMFIKKWYQLHSPNKTITNFPIVPGCTVFISLWHNKCVIGYYSVLLPNAHSRQIWKCYRRDWGYLSLRW